MLVLCARLGMGKLGVVALDGMKITASASKSANRTEETLVRLAAETVARHARADAAEDDLFGEGARGDEVPEDAWPPRRRDERIAAALASLRAERAAAEAERARKEEEYLADAAAGAPRAGNSPAGAAVELARMTVGGPGPLSRPRSMTGRPAAPRRGRPAPARRPAAPAGDYIRVRQAMAKLAAAQARAAGAAARAAEKEKNRTGPGPVRNITDPDARLMPVRGGGFIEGYNTQNVTSEDGLVIATELTDDTTDTAWFEPMLRAAEDAAALITAHRPRPALPGPQRAADPPADGAVSASLTALFLSRRRLPVRAQPHRPRPRPADRHRQDPRPRKSRPRRRHQQRPPWAGPHSPPWPLAWPPPTASPPTASAAT